MPSKPSVTVLSRRAPSASGRTGKPSDLGGLADELLDSMASIRRSGRRRAGRPRELSTLTQSQLDLVRLLRRRPNVSVTQAAEELHLAPNSVSTLVRQLTDTGMLIRTADDADRRVARLELTEDMRRKVGAFRDRRVALVAEAMQRLSPVEQRQLRGAVAIVQRLSRELQHPEVTDG
ncbi:MAG TPA: MarR family transcriptional regulator [Acidimicrobiales bacterium]|jgi:DNA-binding MarR family transcriptional regulator|nr:MarR family transcriptional regulator [Acidimicrobiales bacterium]